MWFILTHGVLSQHVSGLRKFQEVSNSVRVTIVKKANNIVPIDCRMIIMGFLVTVSYIAYSTIHF